MRNEVRPSPIETRLCFDGTGKTSVPNPARFIDALTEHWYSGGRGIGRSERMERVAWLRKKWKDNRAAAELADRLESCHPNKRCHSGACPECTAAGRRLFVRLTRHALKGRANGHEIVTVSIVPTDSTVAPGGLSKEQLNRSVRRWRDAIGRAGVDWCIGGIDWSANEHEADRYPEHWAPHLFLFTATADADGVKCALREQFPATDSTPRPVKVKSWDGNSRAILYAMKPTFWRRIGSDEGTRLKRQGWGKRACRETDKQPLRSRQKLELLLHLDQIGIAGRLFLKGVQFANLKGIGPRFVARNGRRRQSGQTTKLVPQSVEKKPVIQL